jgi:hypothetical protein
MKKKKKRLFEEKRLIMQSVEQRKKKKVNVILRFASLFESQFLITPWSSFLSNFTQSPLDSFFTKTCISLT